MVFFYTTAEMSTKFLRLFKTSILIPERSIADLLCFGCGSRLTIISKWHDLFKQGRKP